MYVLHVSEQWPLSRTTCDWLSARVFRIAKCNYLLHVRLSFRVEQLGSQRTDFHEIWYLSIFRQSVEKIQVSLKSDKNAGYLTCTFMTVSVLLRVINVWDRSRGNQNTHFMFNNPFSENRAVYEMMWKNIAERGRPQITIRHMRIACWILKVTHTEYAILTASTATMVARTRTVLLYTCFPCIVITEVESLLRGTTWVFN